MFTALKDRYFRFMNQPLIHSFLKNNGTVFIATEKKTAAQITTLYDAGHRHFCEKYVQETQHKWAPLNAIRTQCTLHNFGYLQRNKVSKSIHLFDGLESIDRYTLIDKLHTLTSKTSTLRQYYIQLNIGQEPQKKGTTIDELPALIDYALEKQLPIQGLMIIPPKHDNPIPYFKKTRSLVASFNLKECVMGMSNDYAIAIDHGATHIRIGRAIFNE